MKTFRIITLVAICISLIMLVACEPTIKQKNTEDLKIGKIDPKQVEGGKYPAIEFDPERPLNEVDTPYIVPDGPKVGEMQPLNPKFDLKVLKAFDPNSGTQDPLYYNEYDELDGTTATTHRTFPEPSVGENGQMVMTTGNTWMALSDDGGQSFNTINPTTIFPGDWGGLCCDQVVQYIPRYDLFVWLLQYSEDINGENAIRIAAQTSDLVKSSNGTSWTYWDFPRTIFGNSGIIDYNDMSFGNDNFYWTSSVGGGSHRFVIRIPLKELQAKGTINYQYTGSTDAYWSHVTQNGTNGVYWAGHKNNSTMLVYSMMDADGFYSWRDVPINSWPNNPISSIAANGTDWLSDGSWKTYVRAAAIQGNSIFFAWNASSGDGFPEPHIQIVDINKSTFALQHQMQIWNPDFAFAYPYIETNAEGELGMITAFGGGSYDASSGVGVWGDFVIYYPRLSATSRNAYGHYHTVRRSGTLPLEWVATGYTHNADGSVLPYYVRFSH